MLLTNAHKKRNEIMKDRAVKFFAGRRMTVAEAMEQYDRIKRQSLRARPAARKDVPGKA